MSAINLDRIFNPKLIAVVGSDQKDDGMDAAVISNLIMGKYSGQVYPVNERQKMVCGLRAYPSIQHLDPPVYLVILAAPLTMALQIIKECKDVGAGGLVLISSKEREADAKVRELELAIKNEVKQTDLRIDGPGCFGIFGNKSKLNATITRHMPFPGKMAFISQSGAICTSVLDLSIKEQIGFSYLVNLGLTLDVDFADVIDFLGSDSDVNSILIYFENLCRHRNFMSAARAVSRVKPIIVLKAGRTREGAKAAAFQTGTMVGEDEVYDAAFKRAGIVRVKTFEELFDCAELLAKQPRPGSRS